MRHAELKDGLGKAGLKEIPPDLAAIMDGPVTMFIHKTDHGVYDQERMAILDEWTLQRFCALCVVQEASSLNLAKQV